MIQRDPDSAHSEASRDVAEGDRERKRVLDFFGAEGDLRSKPYFGFEDVAHQLRIQQRARHTLALLDRAGIRSLNTLDILESGCGDGDGLGRWIEWGAERNRLRATDLRTEAVNRAAARFGVRVKAACGSELPWPDARFDLVSVHTMFSSIENEELRIRCAKEITRVLRPRGTILWYDTERPHPARPEMPWFGRRELHQLFPSYSLDSVRVTVRPPWARRIARSSLLPLIYELWSRLPGATSHRLALMTRQGRVRQGSIRPDSIRPDSVREDTAREDRAPESSVRQDSPASTPIDGARGSR